jgi:hypothetical protein
MRCVVILMMFVLLATVQISVVAAEPSGKVKIVQLHTFSENMAGISVQGKWGFINDDGKTVVEPVFHEVRAFQKGYAPVKLVNKWGLIDKKGRYVINPSYDDMGTLADNLIAVNVAGKWGYINVKDTMVITPQFSEAQSFSHGLAAVRIDNNWGFIDSDGRFVVNPRFSGAGSFSNGLAPVQVGNQWGFIDKKGNLKIKPQFLKVTSFSGDLAAVQEDSLWGFINDDGRFEINPVYDNASAFSEGLAPVQKDGAWGYINLKGKLVIPFQYKEAGGFSNDVARVVSGDQVRYISPKGKDAGIGVTATMAAAPVPQLPVVPQPAPVVAPLIVAAPKPSPSPEPQKVAAAAPKAKAAAQKSLKTSDSSPGTADIQPLGSLWQNAIVPKQRPIISFMDPDQNIYAFRGTEAFFAYSDGSLPGGKTGYTDSTGKQKEVTIPETLDTYYSKEANLLTAPTSQLNLTGGVSRVFSIAQAAGVVLQTFQTSVSVMGTDTFNGVPIGMVVSSYLTKDDEDGTKTYLWVELAGRSSKEGTPITKDTVAAKLPPVKLEKDVNGKALPRPYYKYKFNADGSHVYAPALSMGLAHDMVAWDWNNDGYTDYLTSYVTNTAGEKDWKNMAVALVFVDGKSLYDASVGNLDKNGEKIKVKFWFDTSTEYTTGGDLIGGLTDVKPANSVRMAIGDLDRDKQPEVVLYYTKVQTPCKDDGGAPANGDSCSMGLPHANVLKVLRLINKGTVDLYMSTSQTPAFKWLLDFNQNVGQWYLQYDSAALAIGDLNGDGWNELVVLHGNTSALYQPSRVYMDIYNLYNDRTCKGNNNTDCTDNYKLDHPVSGADNNKITKTSKMPDGKKTNPVLQASIADLDGDGTAELVWIGTTEDDANKLQINIRAWKHASSDTVTYKTGKNNPLKGDMGNPYTYSLSDYSDWTLDSSYIRYAMTTGFFVYPETNSTSGTVKRFSQIALATTTKGSEDGKLGLRWGGFSWGCNSSDCSLNLLGSGTQKNVAKAINMGPSIVAADLDGDSMIIGQGVKVTVTDSTETLFNIQAPPKHYDEFTYNGVEYKMDAFSTLEDYKATLTFESGKDHITSTTKISQGKFDVQGNYSVNSVNDRLGNYIPPPIFATGLDAAFDFVNDKKDDSKQTITYEMTADSENDDSLLYRSNTHDLWRYPILYPSAVAAQTVAVVDPTTGQTSYVQTQSYLQFVVPQQVESPSAASGKSVSWYQPRHNNLNLFSYPSKLEDILGYPQGIAAKKADDWWKNINGTPLVPVPGKTIGSLDNKELVFTLGSDSSSEKTKNWQGTIGGYLSGSHDFHKSLNDILYEKQKALDFDVSGDGSFGTDSVTTTDASNLMKITVSTPGVGDYVGQSKPRVRPSQQNFVIDGSVYTTDSGVFSLGFAVTNLKDNNSAMWGAKSPYQMAADPALNLPKMYDQDHGKWVILKPDLSTGTDLNSREIRGFQFNNSEYFAAGTSVNGQAIPVNTPVSSTIRIYNYSFIKTGQVTVDVLFQSFNDMDTFPDVTKADKLVTYTIPMIPGRDSGANTNNWQDMKINWTTPSQPTNGYLHVVLSTPVVTIEPDTGKAIIAYDSNKKATYGGGNLNPNNDQGYVLVGIYDPQSTTTAAPKVVKSGANTMNTGASAPGSSSASSSKTLKIVTDSLAVRPIKNSTLGDATTALEVGQKAIVLAKVRFDDAKGDKKSAVTRVNVYLRDGKRVVSHKVLPLLFNAKDYTVRMPYTAPKSAQTVTLEMVVTSAALPPSADGSPRTRIANKVLTINQP